MPKFSFWSGAGLSLTFEKLHFLTELGLKTRQSNCALKYHTLMLIKTKM